MARTNSPAPATARGAADTASDPATATVARSAGDSPTAAVLSAEPGGATVAVIAEHAGISAAAARQALLAQEKAGAATRVKGSRPGLPDTWKPAAEAAPAAEAPDAGSAPGGQLAPADDAAEGETGKAGAEPGPDPAVTAEAAGNVLAIAQAADAAFTPHQVGKVLTRSAGAVANALDKLVSSVSRRWSPTSHAATGSPPPPRTPLATPASLRRPRLAPRDARYAPARLGRRVDAAPAAPSARCTCPRAG
jgi:hypothetical protein